MTTIKPSKKLDDLLNLNKQEFIQLIVTKIEAKEISLLEIKTALTNSKVGFPLEKEKEPKLIKMLSSLGYLFTIVGFLFFISIIWNDINSFTQIFLTLILGLFLYFLGFVLMGKKNIAKINSLSIHFAAMILIPIGIFVSLDKLPNSTTPETLIAFLVFLFLALFYLFTDYKLKSNLFTVACYVFFSFSYYCLSVLFFDTIQINTFRIPALSYMLYSITLIFLPIFVKPGFRDITFTSFQNFGYFSFFLSIFILTFDSIFEPLSLLTYILVIFLADKIKSNSLIILSFVAILMYIFYVNTRYFVNVIGWPISLIFSGLILTLLPYIYTKFKKTRTEKLN